MSRTTTKASEVQVRTITPIDVAAGLEPTASTLRWMFDSHTEPTHPWGTMETRYVFVSPRVAELAMERNSKNRPPSRHWVAYWQDLMTEARFLLTHQGIAFDQLGRLQDGQNRLAAIIATGIGQWLQVTVGCPPKNFADVDAGRGRSLADTMSVAGIPSASLAGSLCRLICLYDLSMANNGLFQGSRRVRGNEAERVAQQDTPLLIAALHYAQRSRDTLEMIQSSAAGMFYLILRANPTFGYASEPYDDEDLPAVWQFLQSVSDGANLPRGDARWLLRKEIPARSALTKRDNVAQLGMALLAWQRFASGDTTPIRWRHDSRMPPVFVVPASKG